MKTIYMIVAKGYTKYFVTEEEKAELEKLAYRYTPDNTDVRKAGGFCCRPELDNQPEINGLLGPMWDGERYIVNGELKYKFDCTAEEKATCERVGVVRYESFAVYDALSR